jgi:hypothetical protein
MTEMEWISEPTPEDNEQELQDLLATWAKWRDRLNREDTEDQDLLIDRLATFGQAIGTIHDN